MNERITHALNQLFERHRIVFWYDANRELRADFEAIDIPGVEKREIANNQFSLKYRLLREEPDRKFLLYHEGPPPDDLNNWLLDVQLAQGEFRTDQTGLLLSELSLGREFAALIQEHSEFFAAVKRTDALKKLLKADDTAGMIRLKMLAVCAGCTADPRFDAIVESLLAELAEGRDDKIKRVSHCGLDPFLWEQMARFFGYASDSPGIRDFVISLFKSCYAMGVGGEVRLTGDALVFLRRWKDNRRHEESFEALSRECADVLGIEADLGPRDFRDLVELDYFRLIDQKIISDLVRAVAGRTVSAGDVALWVRSRRQSRWYREFRHLYEALDFAARFLQTMETVSLAMDDMADAIGRYGRSWFRLDQLYRKFIYHVRVSGQASLMAELTDRIENLYANNFLPTVNDRWQTFVDAASQWRASRVPLQRDFFHNQILPFLNRDKKVCVIVSDALRYEIGEELLSLVRREDRYHAALAPALAMLPTYTQLGMAALLPNRELRLPENGNGAVRVDGQSAQGTANRAQILAKGTEKRTAALKADAIMELRGDDCRALLRDHDVIYIYHNRIDAVGDKRDSEGRAFEAAEETLAELIRLIKKLAAANATNLVVTADHGFIYQDRAIDESDFSGASPEGEEIFFRDRRFLLGKGLQAGPGLRKFSAVELGLAGETEVLIPASINRLRLKGSGSRFVHGGASLQEAVIPVLRINKRRQSDVSAVEVEILRGAGNVITSGQLAVVLYQTGPVTDKIQPRHLRAGIYNESGELISDRHELAFDLTAENPRERELPVRFILTRDADQSNGREVTLKLEEAHAGTSHYKEYKSIRYRLQRSFTSDFDF